MELQNLQQIFNEKIFRIPDYQRGYSWDKQQLDDLWRDVEILEEGKYHYTGVLSVVQRKCEYITVVDGQQRITSLIILIQSICNCVQIRDKQWINGREIQDYKKKYLHIRKGNSGEITEQIFGYERDNPSHVYFKTKILDLQDTENGMPNDTLYTLKLGEAKKFFEDKIKNLEFNKIEILLKKITENLRFNYYTIDAELNEFIAFETMNNRGKSLSTLELLKNRLIYLSTLLKENDDDEKAELRKDINNAWKTIYEYLGKNPKNRLKDDDFLKNHWIMKFQYSREESKVYVNFLLNEYFAVERVHPNCLKYEDIKNYARDIQNSVKSYYYIHNPEESEYGNEVKEWLLKLNRLGFGAFIPLIMSALTHQTKESNVISILKFAEHFVFVKFNIEFRRSNYSNSSIYGQANKCHKDISLFDNIDNIRESLNKDYSFSKEEFLNGVTKGSEQEEYFYSWKGLRYFLYEYELYLQKLHNGENKVQWESVNDETIEHILPQNNKADGWQHFNQELSNKYLHDLGNLLLLSQRINSQIQDKSFECKKENFRYGSYSAIEVSENENWTSEIIEKRTKKMLEFLVVRWELISDE